MEQSMVVYTVVREEVLDEGGVTVELVYAGTDRDYAFSLGDTSFDNWKVALWVDGKVFREWEGYPGKWDVKKDLLRELEKQLEDTEIKAKDLRMQLSKVDKLKEMGHF